LVIRLSALIDKLYRNLCSGRDTLTIDRRMAYLSHETAG